MADSSDKETNALAVVTTTSVVVDDDSTAASQLNEQGDTMDVVVTTGTTTNTTIPPPRSSGRGGGSGGNSSSGRTPVSGRGIVHPGTTSTSSTNSNSSRASPNRSTGNLNSTNGRGHQHHHHHNGGQQQQHQHQQWRQQRPGGGVPLPIQIHQQSGVPFGHVPAYLPGTASLVEQLDQRMLIVLRDGKHLIGTLSSFDQFSNLVLFDTIERRIVTIPNNDYDDDDDDATTTTTGTAINGRRYKYYYTDIPLGIYVVRGDSMVLGGNVIDDNDTNDDIIMNKVSIEQLKELSTKSIAPLEWDFDTDLTA